MDIEIICLRPRHARELSKLLLSELPRYLQYFKPFSFQFSEISSILKSARKDCYWGIRCEKRLVCFFMLRGFDQGYRRPSFGVYVQERFANFGLARLALQFAVSWCKMNKISSVMLKVHPSNQHIRRVYEQMGFKFARVCQRTKHDILLKKMS